jgi:apolipoprotein N-acyltransferase
VQPVQPVGRQPQSLGLLAVGLVVAALANSASLAWPFSFFFSQGQPIWWLQGVALIVLAWALAGCTSWKQAAVVGQLFCTIWLSGVFWWLFVAMHTYAGLSPVLAAMAVVALAAALSLYYALACAGAWSLMQRSPQWAALVFAVLWTMAEMARGTWLTGFGWGAVGYAHLDGPLAWFVPWVGAYGVCALVAWFAMALVQRKSLGVVQRVALGVFVATPLLLPQAWNDWTVPAGSISVTLLQGNIPQNEKFEAGSGVPIALQWYDEQLKAAGTDLVIAPETAIPVLQHQLPDDYWDSLSRHFARGTQHALVGIPLGSFTQGYTNSVLALGAGPAQSWQYDKHHLVPFGEFIPPLFKWFIRLMNIPLGDFNRGPLGQASYLAHGQRIAPNICYEDLFGEELGARFSNPETSPTLFANVSNIGWFGDTVAIDQHLHISRMRSLEFQRPFARATNTGATGFIDHTGVVTGQLTRYTRGVLVGTMQGRSGLTPFAWWVSRFGLWPLWLAGLFVLLLAVRKSSTRS